MFFQPPVAVALDDTRDGAYVVSSEDSPNLIDLGGDRNGFNGAAFAPPR